MGGGAVGGDSVRLSVGRMFDPIAVSETTNQIIATGSAAEVEYIAKLISELDSQVVTVTIPLKRTLGQST